MKKVILTICLSFLLMALILPYFVGRIQYTNVERTMQNFGNESNDDFESDGEIENALRVYDFKIGVSDKPSFADYYNSGLSAIKLEL